ncbi:hypothetical protein GQ54DRAFT_296182 [Martensiomyces pterosporus]|nr:hypothetical protein GQ54DRAFT_296182 [Martensiomyces pterosporus]
MDLCLDQATALAQSLQTTLSASIAKVSRDAWLLLAVNALIASLACGFCACCLEQFMDAAFYKLAANASYSGRCLWQQRTCRLVPSLLPRSIMSHLPYKLQSAAATSLEEAGAVCVSASSQTAASSHLGASGQNACRISTQEAPCANEARIAANRHTTNTGRHTARGVKRRRKRSNRSPACTHMKADLEPTHLPQPNSPLGPESACPAVVDAASNKGRGMARNEALAGLTCGAACSSDAGTGKGHGASTGACMLSESVPDPIVDTTQLRRTYVPAPIGHRPGTNANPSSILLKQQLAAAGTWTPIALTARDALSAWPPLRSDRNAATAASAPLLPEWPAELYDDLTFSLFSSPFTPLAH